MTMGDREMVVGNEQKPKKDASKLLGIYHLVFSHAKQLEIDFFDIKCLNPLFFHPLALI